jgi:hypothetical protein
MLRRYSRRNEQFTVSGDPTCQHVLRDFPGGQRKDYCGRSLLWGIEVDAVESEKHDHGRQRGPLVSVNESVIPRDPKPVSRGECGKIGFAVSELIDRPRQRGFEKAAIAQAIGTAKKGELLGVKVKDDIDFEPSWLVHFARAL